MATAKEEIRKMLDTLPENATWEDVQHSIYVRERVERGRREADQQKLIEEEAEKRRVAEVRGKLESFAASLPALDDSTPLLRRDRQR